MVKKITKARIIGLYLNDYSKRYYLREMESLLNKPHQTIKPYAEELVKEGILVKEVRKKIIEFRLNFKNQKIHDYLIISEKERLIEKLQEETLLNLLYEKLSKYFQDSTFIIFGSASEQIRKGSDIDLLVIGGKNINSEVKNFEEVYNKKIHKIQVKEFNKATQTLVKEVYKKHLILNNTEKILGFFGELYEKNKLV